MRSTRPSSATARHSFWSTRAGVRRKRRHRQGIEYFSELRTRRAAERADIALVLVDSSEGIVEHDLTIADIARRAGCSTLVVLSKWDVTNLTIEDARARLHAKLRQRPKLLAVSAQTGRGLGKLLDAVEELFERRIATVTTSELNSFLGELREERPGPAKQGRRLRLKYGTQTGVRPPRFRVFVNDGALMTRDYAYWLENKIRERLSLAGTPVVIDFHRAALVMRFLVVGGGSWGTAFSALLVEQGHDVTLACRDAQQAEEIARTARNPRYLSEAELDGLRAVELCNVEVSDADFLVFALPSAALGAVRRRACRQHTGLDPHQGPRPGRWTPTLGARGGAACGRAERSEPCRGDHRGPTRGSRRRKCRLGAGGTTSGRRAQQPVSRLSQRRSRRRRALCGSQERGCAGPRAP